MQAAAVGVILAAGLVVVLNRTLGTQATLVPPKRLAQTPSPSPGNAKPASHRAAQIVENSANHPARRPIPLSQQQRQEFEALIRQLSTPFRTILLPLKAKYGLSDKDLNNLSYRLSSARVAQLLYEASVANVKKENGVLELDIPTYDGAAFLDEIREDMSPVSPKLASSADLANIVVGNMDCNGAYSQSLRIAEQATPNGGPLAYDIEDTYADPSGKVPSFTTRSHVRKDRPNYFVVLIAPFGASGN